MATITPANLSYKDKDGDLGEVKSLTDTDVTLLNNALQDIEDLKLAYSPGFAKRDFSNVTQDGKDAAISWGMPDYDRAIDIRASLSTTNTQITITEPSYIEMYCNYIGSGGYVSVLYKNDEALVQCCATSGYPDKVISPIQETGTYNFRITGSTIISVKIVPCKGAN